MKTKIIIFASILISLVLYAQDPVTWSTVLNNGVWEARAYSALETTDGNYILTGCLFDQDPSSPDWQLKHSWIVKLNAEGDTLWTKRYFTNFYVNGEAGDAVETPENEFIISGNEIGGYLLKMDTEGNQLYYKRYEYCTGFGKTIKTSDGNYLTVSYNPAGIFKFDNNCDSLWCSTIVKEEYWRLDAIAETNDGYIGVGYYDDGVANQTYSSGYIIKYDLNGNKQWDKVINYTKATTMFRDVLIELDGSFIICGRDFDNDTFISKYDKDGSLIWFKPYSNLDDIMRMNSIIKANDGSYIITGEHYVSPNIKLFIMKTDQNGDSLWTKRHTTYYGESLEYPANSEGYDIIQTADSGYLAVGETFPDLWALKVDENGELSGISEDSNIISDFKLFQNYPNPFNSETVITYSLKKPSEVAIIVFNTKGEFVQNLVKGKQNTGKHFINFHTDNLNSGVYYYQLNINGVIKDSRRMLYLK